MNIDFVIPWVDGNDQKWRNQMERYRRQESRQDSRQEEMTDAAESRYRDWDNLRYWFRGVETFAPWVNRVHFITWGHLPEWLNKRHPTLNIVRHTDFIPKEFLPTFSSHPIELSMHRIAGLAEKFVYFNDDMFLLRPVAPERFFQHELPCDNLRLNIIPPSSIAHIIMNNVDLINMRHEKRRSIRRNLSKWFNRNYTFSDIVKTLTLMPWNTFAGFKDHHMPQPFLRSTFEKLWEEEGDLLAGTVAHRFRNVLDYSQYLMRYEQLVTGYFSPVSMCDCRLDTLGEESIRHICDCIAAQKYAMACLNDSDTIHDFDGVKKELNAAFEQILPNKCSYER